MKISLTEIVEDREITHDSTGDREIIGQIVDQERTIAYYFVSWNLRSRRTPAIFDIAFGYITDLPVGEKVRAISIAYDKFGSIDVLDASSRPFTRTMRSFCIFLDSTSLIDDLSISPSEITKYIIKHDSRLIEFL